MHCQKATTTTSTTNTSTNTLRITKKTTETELKRRQRKNHLKTMHLFYFGASSLGLFVIVWTSIIQETKAFSIRSSQTPFSSHAKNIKSFTQCPMAPAYVQLFTENDNDDVSSMEDTDDPESSRWLRWMTGGTPRGVAEVKMRDPPALGGVARSDRYAARDWLHNALSLPTSRILKSISFPVFSMTFWGMTISLFHKYLEMNGKQEIAAKLCIPIQPHSLMVSALGLLLVFRTNSAYQRFAEGRKIWEDILSIARDLSRLSKLYEPQIGTLKLRRVNRLLAAFPYLLRFRIKPNSIMRKLDDKTVERDPETSLILYQDHGTYSSG